MNIGAQYFTGLKYGTKQFFFKMSCARKMTIVGTFDVRPHLNVTSIICQSELRIIKIKGFNLRQNFGKEKTRHEKRNENILKTFKYVNFNENK